MHIVQILDQSRPTSQVQVATLVKIVVASEETDHDYYVKANEFAGKNNTYEKFNKAVESAGTELTVQTALNLAPWIKR